MGELVFKEKEHIYEYEGRRIPSVTSILNIWILTHAGYVNTISGVVIGKEVFEAAQDFGTAIHLAIKYLLTTGLNWDGLDPSLIPPLKQAERWINDWKIKPIQEFTRVFIVEQPMMSKRYGYAGTLDIFCEISKVKGEVLCLTDWKTGDYGNASAQLAAYENLVREYTGCRKTIEKRVLYLPKDGGDYKFEQMNDKDSWSYFLSRLNCYKYERGK